MTREVQSAVSFISDVSVGVLLLADMNVEHAQLLLFLFHNLQLMQKKVVLLSVARTIINVAPVAQR